MQFHKALVPAFSLLCCVLLSDYTAPMHRFIVNGNLRYFQCGIVANNTVILVLVSSVEDGIS